MKLQSKFNSTVIPVTLFFVVSFGIWSYFNFSKSVVETVDEYLKGASTIYINQTIKPRHLNLKNNGLEDIQSFVELNKSEAAELLNEIYLPWTGHTMIFEEGNGFIFCSSSYDTIGDKNIWSNVIKKANGRGALNSSGTLQNADKSWFYHINHFEPWGWTIIFAVDKSEIQKKSFSFIFGTIVMMSLITITLVALILVITRKYIIKPINIISDYTNNIHTNRKSINISISTNDEISELADNISLMSEAIHKKELELKNLNEVLNTKYNETHQALINNEKKYRMLFDTMDLGCVYYSFNNNNTGFEVIYEDVNKSYEHLTGLRKEQIIGKTIFDAFPGIEESNSDLINAYESLMKDGKSINLELYLQAIDRYLNISAYLVDKNSFAVILQDVTNKIIYSRKIEESLKEKNILLQEIHHRVKNNLQIIISMLMLQGFRIDDKSLKSKLNETISRIYSMSLVHEELYRRNNFTNVNIGDYINKLFLNMKTIFDTSGIEFSVSESESKINAEKAIPIGLIVNEMITNSLKYAFDGVEEKRIEISIKQADDSLEIIYSDSGIGFDPEMFNRSKGLGTTMIKELVKQLKGSLELNSEKGCVYKLVIEVDNE